MKWLSTFRGVNIERRDALGRVRSYVWETCRDCLYDECEACNGYGGRYLPVADGPPVQLYSSTRWTTETP